jgi:hypothetical protein
MSECNDSPIQAWFGEGRGEIGLNSRTVEVSNRGIERINNRPEGISKRSVESAAVLTGAYGKDFIFDCEK